MPYYWVGCKMYDVLAGKENMESSYLMTKGRALETFPMLKQDGLVGALVYYDGTSHPYPHSNAQLSTERGLLGQHNDSRMNIALIMTAVKLGAVVANHCEVTELHKGDSNGKLNGARVKDKLTGKEFNVRAKVSIFYPTCSSADELMSFAGHHQRNRSLLRHPSQTRQPLPRTHRPTLLRNPHHPPQLLLPTHNGSSRPRHLRRPRHLLPTLARQHHSRYNRCTRPRRN